MVTIVVGKLNMEKLTLKTKVFSAAFLLLGIMMLSGGRAHAATLYVSGSCPLEDAITSINNGANENTCSSTGGYGSTDTIILPSGTTTLNSDNTVITEPVTIQGSGIGDSILSGAGNFETMRGNSDSILILLKDFTITAFQGHGINISGSNVTLDNIEVDGAGSTSDGSDYFGIYLRNATSMDNTINATNIFVHGMHAVSGVNDVHTLAVDQAGGSTTTANFSGTTVSNISNDDGNVGGFFMDVNAFDFSDTPLGGTINASVINTTVDSLVASGGVSAFGLAGFAFDDPATIEASITNSTVTGVRGGPNSFGFFNAGASQDTNLSTVHTTIQNSLLADNLSDGIKNNCAVGNYNSFFSFTGPVNATITSGGHNLADDATCTDFTQEGDQQNLGNIITTLGALQDNGGVVQTRALLAGSPAIGAGAAVLGISTDARGIARSASQWDVGAYQTLGANTVNPSGNNASNNGGTLADTGQQTNTLIIAAIFLISSVFTLHIVRSKQTNKLNNKS
ncbi:MAG: trimeric autotransporter adhesin [Patescibacteria group bacterium]|jgi:hypothetical protein|nr:trimeric autotransporter adhesin [Patescibacteria group bacterium]